MKQPRSGREKASCWPTVECEVQHKERLTLHREKRAEWLDHLLGQDDHAISRQLLAHELELHSLRSDQRSAPDCSLAEVIFTSRKSVHGSQFATTGFVPTQILAIRRLSDPAAQNPRRQVISLRRLVDDITKHRDLFTREMFVCFNGLPYDPEPGRKRYWQEASRRVELCGGVGIWSEAYETSGPEAWRHAERLHEEFDHLSGSSPELRARTERVPDEVFSRLVQLLDDPAIEKARVLANKRVAHAADPASRDSESSRRPRHQLCRR